MGGPELKEYQISRIVACGYVPEVSRAGLWFIKKSRLGWTFRIYLDLVEKKTY